MLMSSGCKDDYNKVSKKRKFDNSDKPYEIYTYNGIGMIRDSENKSITSVVIPCEAKGIPITVVGDGAFAFCQSLASVSLPESITQIQGDAFLMCTALNSINLPDTIAEIQLYAFSGCKSLASITLPASLEFIGQDAFSDCTALKSVSMAQCTALETIEEYAFSACESLASITLPPSLKTIGFAAFDDCLELKTVDIPASVESINHGAFSYCASLQSINVDKANQNYSSLDDGNKDKTVLKQFPCGRAGQYIVPNSVEEIADFAFSDSPLLEEVVLPQGIREIGTDAFITCTCRMIKTQGI